MSRYLMVKSDLAVYIDDKVILPFDFTGTKDFHAIQYNSESQVGHIEYGGDGTILNKKITSVDDIKTFSGITLDEFIDRFETQLQISEAEAEAKAKL
jgi:hypothetical protein